MTELWSRLERQLEIHAPQLAASFRSGSSKVNLDTFETEIGQRLPDELREAYLRHDGCDYGGNPSVIGLFGRFQWCPLSEVIDMWRWNRDGFDPEDAYFLEEDDPQWSSAPVRPWNSCPPQWIPIGKLVGAAAFLYVDLLPGPKGKRAQLVGHNVHGGVRADWIEANGLQDFLVNLLVGLEAGSISVDARTDTQHQYWAIGHGEEFRLPDNVLVWSW